MNNEEKILAMLEQQAVTLGILVNKVEKLEQGQARIETDVTELKSEISSTKEHVILMENDNKLNFGGLHYGYRLVYDILDKEIRPDIADIKARDDWRDLRIVRMESDRKTS